MSDQNAVTPTPTQVALVTGASRGIGFELACQYIEDGWRVIVVGEFFWAGGRPSKHHADTRFDMCVPIRLGIDRSCCETPLIAKRLRKSKPGTARSRAGRQLVRE